MRHAEKKDGNFPPLSIADMYAMSNRRSGQVLTVQ